MLSLRRPQNQPLTPPSSPLLNSCSPPAVSFFTYLAHPSFSRSVSCPFSHCLSPLLLTRASAIRPRSALPPPAHGPRALYAPRRTGATCSRTRRTGSRTRPRTRRGLLTHSLPSSCLRSRSRRPAVQAPLEELKSFSPSLPLAQSLGDIPCQGELLFSPNRDTSFETPPSRPCAAEGGKVTKESEKRRRGWSNGRVRQSCTCVGGQS